MVTLYCEETPELKLGPGTASSWPSREAGADVIVFARGFTSFEESDYPLWKEWMAAPGTPHIRVIDESTGEGLAGDGPHRCPICERMFKSEFALNGHLRSHAPKGATK